MKSVRSDVSRRLSSTNSASHNTATAISANTNGATNNSTTTSHVRSTAGQSKRVSSFTVPVTGPGGSKKASTTASSASQAKKEAEASKVPVKDLDESAAGAAASGQEKEVAEKPGQETAGPQDGGDVTDASGEKSRRRKSRVKEVPVMPVLEFDADRYNADGSLRTMHRMPDSSKAWEEAQKARYIRLPPRLSRDSDKELSVKEIFRK